MIAITVPEIVRDLVITLVALTIAEFILWATFAWCAHVDARARAARRTARITADRDTFHGRHGRALPPGVDPSAVYLYAATHGIPLEDAAYELHARATIDLVNARLSPHVLHRRREHEWPK